MFYNYLLEIQQDSLYSNFSRDNPQLEIFLWCNYRHDILEIRGEEDILINAKTDLLNSLGTVLEVFPESGSNQLILKRCRCGESPLSQILSRYDCLELPPVKYFHGRLIMNLLVSSESPSRIIKDINNEIRDARVKVLKLAPIKKLDNQYPLYLPLDSLKQGITKRQMESLSIAFNHGYYEVPRQAILKTLALEMNIKRRTYEDHLRRAEKSVMEFLIPVLMLSQLG